MEFNVSDYVTRHMQNSHEWHLPFLPPIHLPSFLRTHELTLFSVCLFLMFLFGHLYKKSPEAPRGLTNLLEMLVVFVRDQICIAFLGREDGLKMAPLFCTFFFLILGLNLAGLIPIFPTVTSNINVTAGLALVTLTFMTVGAIYKNGFVPFLKGFAPSGVPLPILFIFIPIEIAGLFIRPFALTIRLFANMLAGHIVILSILGLVVILGLVALPAILLAVFIYILEILVVFIQAYIFTCLSAMFIAQTYHPEHH